MVETEGSVSRVTKSLLLVEAVADDEDDDDDTHGIGSRRNGKATEKRGGGDEGGAAKGGADGGEARLSPRALFRLRLSFDATRVLLRAALLLVGPPHLCKMFRYKVYSIAKAQRSSLIDPMTDQLIPPGVRRVAGRLLGAERLERRGQRRGGRGARRSAAGRLGGLPPARGRRGALPRARPGDRLQAAPARPAHLTRWPGPSLATTSMRHHDAMYFRLEQHRATTGPIKKTYRCT